MTTTSAVPAAIGERPPDTLQQMIDDYPTFTAPRAPGLLHAIARFGGGPAEYAISAAFLARVGSEEEIIEPDAYLRESAIRFMVRFPMARVDVTDPAHLLLIETMVRFFAAHPHHFWQCMVHKGDDSLVQRFLTDCYRSFVGGTNMNVRHEWSIEEQEMVRAMVNCRLSFVLTATPFVIPLLYHRVALGVAQAEASRLSTRALWFRNSLLDGSLPINVETSDTHIIVENAGYVIDLCAAAKFVAKSTDAALRWEADALLESICKFRSNTLYGRG
ncbi:MAG: hypothetical protein V1778_04305 [bacterium]